MTHGFTAGSRRKVLCVALLAALVVLSLAADAGAAVKVRTFTAVKEEPEAAVFKLDRATPVAIKSANIRVGHYRAPVSPSKVRRGVKRGVLRVRVPLRALKSPQVMASRRRKSTLVVVTVPPPVVDPAPAPAPPPVPPADTSTSTSTAKAITRPAGSPPLSDAEAASLVRRSSFEPRPGNAVYNSRVPSSADLAAYRAEPTSTPEVQYGKVTGNFTGTTDEIIQWAAHKWGLAEDTLRAVAAQESWWTQSYVGDSGASPGLFQMRHDPVKSPVGHRLVQDYTAFNADLYGAFVRYYFDGSCSWCNDSALTPYAAGQEWMSVGAHFNPYPWGNAGQLDYIGKVKNYLTQSVWAQPGF